MMTQFHNLLGALVLLLVLSACTVSTGDGDNRPWSPSEYERVNATSEPVELASGTLAAESEEVFYRINVPPSVAQAGDVLYFELSVGDEDAGLGANVIALRLYDSGGNVAASSGGPDGFSAGEEAALSFGSSSLQTTNIGASLRCIGPCIIWPGDAGYEYVSLENRSGFPSDFTLYAYSEDLQDTNEPTNDLVSGAVTITDDDFQGAIETLWDEDHWHVPVTGVYTFSSGAAEELQLRARIVNRSSTPIAPGTDIALQRNDIVRVYSASEWAGAPAASDYFLERR